MSYAGGAGWTRTSIILVLFILLVIISRVWFL
ncbi:YjcZ family sporulation protein [Paenibacillus sp. D51F]